MTRIGGKPSLPALLSMVSVVRTPGTASRVQRVVEKPILVKVGGVVSERKAPHSERLEAPESPWSDV
jgi:hypothetical protein